MVRRLRVAAPGPISWGSSGLPEIPRPIRCSSSTPASGTRSTIRPSAPARIRLPAWDREVAFDIRPFEIRTFRIPRDPSGDVAETDLLERPAAT